MKKYKRWILILTALTVFVVVQVDSLKATSLTGRFAKHTNQTSNSSTTTSTIPANDQLKKTLDEVPEDDDGPVDANGTKIILTGIPQIDYVWDPNLPRELNGFNLSHYPFLDSMPAEEDIGFDCEDKINGFYASIKFGCQLYHHCLYGVRSDFICANFTAFDQKTFICHFVSEVDCKNSYKYWSRNDDLYKATTQKTTSTPSGLMPLIDRGFYNRTRYSFLNSQSSSQNNNNNNNNNNPQTTNDSQKSPDRSPSTNKDPPATPNNNKNINSNRNTNNDDFDAGRPARPLRRPPFRRRRPYDYYEDEYEDEMYEERDRRRNRPRNRRPQYDEYDTRRPGSRRPYYDDFDDYDYEYDRRPMRNRNRSEARNSGSRYDERRAGGIHNDSRRRPAYDDDKRRTGDRRPQQQDDRIRGEERRFADDDRRDRYDDNKNYNNRRNNPLDENKRKPTETVERKQLNQEETVSDEKLVKPVGTGSIFDRPRPSPKVNRFVPKSEKNKFAYKASESPNVNVRDGNKNDDANASYEYEDISISSSTSSTTPKSSVAPSSTKPFSFQKLKPASSLSTTSKTTTTVASADDGAEVYEYVYEDEDYDTAVPPTQKPIIEISSIKPKDERAGLYSSRVRNDYIASSTLPSTTSTTAASSPDSFRLNRYKNDNSRENIQQQPSYVDPLVRKPLVPSIIPNGNANNRKFANKQTVFEPTTQEIPSKKFSFQNAYNNRNLDNKQDTEPIADDKEQLQKTGVKVIKRPFLPSRGGSPYKGRGLQPVGLLAEQQQQQSNEKQEDEKNVSYNDGNRKQTDTQKLTLEDLYEEYDVDLNDALNPMLKPLTSSRNVQGFSSRSSTVDVNDKDHPQATQNSKVVSKTDHLISKPAAAAQKVTTTTTPLPEYYEDELEYDTYADDVA